ncbi:MAG: DUF1786 family protein [Candidatus Hodarchaeota archaeon]
MFLGIDVGQGTTDLLLWDHETSIENALQFVFPSATSRMAQQIRLTRGDVFCHGKIMGGGPLVAALKEKIQTGARVYMTSEAAMSIRYHLEFVEDLGIQILGSETSPPTNVTSFITGDFNFPWLLEVFQKALGEVPVIDQVGLAVQDHGHHEKSQLARETRLQFYKERLQQSGNLYNLGFRGEVPNRFPRLRASWLEKEKWFPKADHYIIDTSPIAILGALQDKTVLSEAQGIPKIVINFGNGHTLVCALSSDDKVIALFEHHTGIIKKPEKFDLYLAEFLAGNLKSKDVIQDRGHGSYYLEPIPQKASDMIIAIGPRRSIGKNSQFQMVFANPGGSMMMAGPIAMAKALREKNAI